MHNTILLPEVIRTCYLAEERTDIQRLLRTQIEVLDDEMHVLPEELATGRTASGVPNAIDDRRRFMR